MGNNKTNKSEATKATHHSKDQHFAGGISLMRMKSNLGRPRLSPSDVKTVVGLRAIIKRDMEDLESSKERIYMAMQSSGDLLKSVLGVHEEHHGDNPKGFQIAMVSRIIGFLNFAFEDLHEMTEDRKPKDRECLQVARKALKAKRNHSKAMRAAWARRKAKAHKKGGAL